jgi:hypothetical protein|tara:strand:- start:85 stop:897 length:813 start_codon:yes stop_codon:yes gene_type:complete
MDIQFYMPESNIVINEINYHPAEDFDSGDWVELYNSTSAAIDMSSWSLKDEDDEHVFILAENTFLGADQYIVLCRDIISFSALFPQVENVVGDFDFGLSGGGELIRLFDSNRSLIDTVHYDDDPPWPEEPDGNGPTLELINPSLDNALATNWVASEEHGTPGSVNTGFVSINDQSSLIPSELTLFQNYPNPFNATTTINFTIPSVETLHATSLLQIFDIIGRLVETLVSGELVAGKHSVVWDASNIASGVYFYSIQTENNVQTRKMILLK